MQAAPPPAVIEVAPVQAVADFVVVSRDTRNEVVASADLPLTLVKAGRTEQALLRQAVFVTSTLTVTRPTAPGPDTLRWSHDSFLQRQLCLTSMTGQFSCTVAEVVTLPDTAAGTAPAVREGEPGDATPAAEAARLALGSILRAKAAALFDGDRRAKFDPMLKAAGVVARRRAPVRN